MNNIQKYRLSCTLTFGDIYGQIIVWLIVVFLSIAGGVALWTSSNQTYALGAIALVVVLSLPFLLFAFVTTLLNHIEVSSVDPNEEEQLEMSTPGQQTATSLG
ncbi:MAG: hypothetical protein F6K22_22855 [Okeania sp. SIO2F4]|uniref:hypothetical protein n=1 Tax=Okeania sp. SIO2F4 TaxID=2607790 RepID=UPI00142AC768|nr:hypothetical protein [Okeania sp. SIO2F4]MDJ0519359.1 hypothetical protein [Trichodesmium sp. MO_231.B1]NES05405.1 hypothetical protein [Okeania sp. SIO2F4]